jgi:hypothetical protein
MAQYPEIHPEECPFCGGQLKLVTGKYLWDYYYECKKCYPLRRFHFKNNAPPDIKAVYQTEEYKNHLAWTQRYATASAFPKPSAPQQTISSTGVSRTMTQIWEYKVICGYEGLQHWADHDQKMRQMEIVLNKYGALGWEIVQEHNYDVILKRPKQF